MTAPPGSDAPASETATAATASIPGATPARLGPTDRTTPARLRDRATYERAAVEAVLDEALICHIGYVVAGEPVVLPTIHARLGDAVYLHTSTGSTLARLAAGAVNGVPVCVTVTLVDGIVLARSQFHHSMNYRSVVVRGPARLVTNPAERERAFARIVDHVAAGRATDSRPANAKELAATGVLRVDLLEASLKERTGGPNDDAEDAALPHWAGVLPVSPTFGAPQAAADLDPAIPVPGYLKGYRRPASR